MLGDDVERSLAATLAGVDEPAAETAADELARAGVLADVRPLRFLHAIVRDAVVSRFQPACGARCTRRPRKLLAARHASLDAIAVPPARRRTPRPRLGRRSAGRRGAPGARRGEPEDRAERGLSARSRSRRASRSAPSWCSTSRAPRARSGTTSRSTTSAPRTRSRRPDDCARGPFSSSTWAAGPAVDIEHVLPQLERAIADVQGNRELTLELEAARYAALSLSPARRAERWEAGVLPALGAARRSHRRRTAPARPARDRAVARRRSGRRGRGLRRTGGRRRAASGTGMSLMFAHHRPDQDRPARRRRTCARARAGAARRCGSLTAYALVCTFRGAVAARRGDLAAAEADLRAGLDALPRGDWQRPQLRRRPARRPVEYRRAARGAGAARRGRLGRGPARRSIDQRAARQPLAAPRGARRSPARAHDALAARRTPHGPAWTSTGTAGPDRAPASRARRA